MKVMNLMTAFQDLALKTKN